MAFSRFLNDVSKSRKSHYDDVTQTSSHALLRAKAAAGGGTLSLRPVSAWRACSR